MGDLDNTTARGLAGQTVDDALYRLRARHEKDIHKPRADFEEKRAEAEMLKAQLDAEPQELPSAGLDIEALLAIATMTLADKVEALKQARKILEAFRIRHGLTRMSTEPETAVSLLFLLLMVFFESGVNTAFFLNAHMSASPIGALLISFLISFTNVLLSATAGYFVGRQLHYGRHAVDADELAFAVVRRNARYKFHAYLLVMGLFHGVVGMVRAQENLEKVSFSLLLELPSTPEALFLIMSGVALSALAFNKGVTAFSDAYPGYGERHQAVIEAHNDLLDLYDDYSDEIEEAFEEAEHATDQFWKIRRSAIHKHGCHVKACGSAKRHLERAVSLTESKLKTEIASLANHHHVASGKREQVPQMALNELASCQHFLEGLELPPFYGSPDIRAHKLQLEQDKSRTLKSLSTLFEEALAAASIPVNPVFKPQSTPSDTGENTT